MWYIFLPLISFCLLLYLGILDFLKLMNLFLYSKSIAVLAYELYLVDLSPNKLS